jgi:hypothetical protein
MNKKALILTTVVVALLLVIGGVVGFVILPSLNKPAVDLDKMMSDIKSTEFDAQLNVKLGGAALGGVELSTGVGLTGKIDMTDKSNPKMDMTVDITKIKDLLTTFMGSSGSATMPSKMRVIVVDKFSYTQDPTTLKWTKADGGSFTDTFVKTTPNTTPVITPKTTKTGDETFNGKAVAVYTMEYNKTDLNKALADAMKSAGGSQAAAYTMTVDSLDIKLKVNKDDNTPAQLSINGTITMVTSGQTMQLKDLSIVLTLTNVNKAVSITAPAASEIQVSPTSSFDYNY